MDSTLLGALIGAAVASIGVTLAKDTKVSEFRQQWIDALRSDVAEFIALASRVFQDSHGLIPRDEKVKPDELILLNERLNTLMYRIVMRLDLKDKQKKPEHHALLLAVSKAQSVATTKTTTRAENSAAADELWGTTSTLLDTAWERVKAGEPRYRWVLRSAYTVLILCLLALATQTYRGLRHPDASVAHFAIDAPVKVEEHIVTTQSAPQTSAESIKRSPTASEYVAEPVKR